VRIADPAAAEVGGCPHRDARYERSSRPEPANPPPFFPGSVDRALGAPGNRRAPAARLPRSRESLDAGGSVGGHLPRDDAQRRLLPPVSLRRGILRQAPSAVLDDHRMRETSGRAERNGDAASRDSGRFDRDLLHLADRPATIRSRGRDDRWLAAGLMFFVYILVAH